MSSLFRKYPGGSEGGSAPRWPCEGPRHGGLRQAIPGSTPTGGDPVYPGRIAPSDITGTPAARAAGKAEECTRSDRS